MAINKKQQLSLFLALTAVAPHAVASTCSPGYYDILDGSDCIAADPGRYVPVAGATISIEADLGYYVPTSGASSQTAAEPGYFVSNTGSSEQIAAPPGYFVPNSAATVAQPAPPGFYVPTSGAIAGTPVADGFYVPVAGADEQLPAGGMAAPLTATLQSSAVLGALASDLLQSPSESKIRFATSYERATVDQEGLAAGDFATNIVAASLQADVLQNAYGRWGLQAGYGHHNLFNGGDVSNEGNSYEVGAYNSGSVAQATYHVFTVFGQTYYDNKRTINFQQTGSTRHEVLNSDGTVTWYGVRSGAVYPLVERLSAVANLDVLHYQAESMAETGSATLGGSSTAVLTDLTADSLDYIAAPVTMALRIDLVGAAAGASMAPVTLDVGAISNIAASEQNLRVTSGVSSFDLPVQQTAVTEGLLKLRFNLWEIADGANIAGGVEGRIGPDSTAAHAGLNLVKRW